eukprot:9134799-Lingulodinium_polyedra.AAC.1
MRMSISVVNPHMGKAGQVGEALATLAKSRKESKLGLRHIPLLGRLVPPDIPNCLRVLGVEWLAV